MDDPALRRTLFELCAGVARADRIVHESEMIVLIEAIDSWNIDQSSVRDVEAPASPTPRPATSKQVPGIAAAR